mgnify:CR=1 FL=1
MHDQESKLLIDRLTRPFHLFAQKKIAGAIVLMAATMAAIVWANSSFAPTYHDLLDGEVSVSILGFEIRKPLLLWINDGLMAIFFFVVGLEIKREILAGELSSLRKAMLPIAGAVGGMLVPALVFALVVGGGEGSNGWGVPMATDIAFALGVLMLLGDRVPLALKVFLTALAIVDDIGAIAIIAIFYTGEIGLVSLGIGMALVGLSIAMNLSGVRNSVAYFIVGTLVWVAFLKSGVHATLASVVMAMTIPARTSIDGKTFLERIEGLTLAFRQAGVPTENRLLDSKQQHLLQSLERSVEQATAPLQQLEHALMPIVTFLVLPVFALANAGLQLSSGVGDALTHPVSLGIVAGLVIGKQLGIFAFAWLAVKLGVASLPAGVTWRQIHAVSILGGVGFTMSLFVAGLAFSEPHLLETARLGILLASLLAAVIGAVALERATRKKGTP